MRVIVGYFLSCTKETVEPYSNEILEKRKVLIPSHCINKIKRKWTIVYFD